MRTECEVSTTGGSGWVGFRNCLSLLLIWTLICGLAAPRVNAAGNWLIELSNALLLTPEAEQLETPTDAVISRTRPTLNSGRIEGNLRVLKAEPFSIGAQTTLTGDLFLAGSASIQSSGAVVDEGGPSSAAYAVSISSVTGKIHTRSKPITLPADFPSSVPAPSGLRTITIRTQSDVAAIGNWQTVRDLNVARAGLNIDIPPGNYGTFTVNGNSRLNFTAGTYNFANTFNLDGSASLQATGNVNINVAQNLMINSGAVVLGSYTSPGDVRLNVLGSSLNINGSSQVSALVRAYNATVTLNGNAQVRGQVISSGFTLNGGRV